MSWHEQSWFKLLQILDALVHLLGRRIRQVITADDGVNRTLIKLSRIFGDIYQAGMAAPCEDYQTFTCMDALAIETR